MNGRAKDHGINFTITYIFLGFVGLDGHLTVMFLHVGQFSVIKLQ